MKIPNYKSLDLEIKETYTSGELTKREYYKSYNGTKYEGLMVSEDYVYAKDGLSKEVKRTITITYYKGGKSVGTETKVIDTVQK